MDNNDIEVLLVENNVNDAELTILSLRKDNVATHIVHLKDGVAALDFLFGKGKYKGRDTTNQPKVILLDLKMPKLNGLEMLAKLNSDELTNKIPVVVLTSSKELSDVEKSYQLGANSYIVKPVDFARFRKVVNDLGIYWLSINQSLT
jgi:two-component system response regulator